MGSQRVRHEGARAHVTDAHREGARAHVTDPHRELYSQQPRRGSLGSETDPHVNVEGFTGRPVI